ncbi:Nn.00g064760.m01.CDS01 [Neocucurbitaria sp. VM-36]
MEKNTQNVPSDLSTPLPITPTGVPTSDAQASHIDGSKDVGATDNNGPHNDDLSTLCTESRQALLPPLATSRSSVSARDYQGSDPLNATARCSLPYPKPYGLSVALPWAPTLLPALPTRPARDVTPFPRRRVQEPPTPGKVYYIPDRRHIPDSTIHKQKSQAGFFQHPALVTGVEHDIAYFYALTSAPPHAISQLNMCLRVGTTTINEGISVLKLADGSVRMQTETWVNLEQRFYIEWKNLDHWAIDVCVDLDDTWKIWRRVQELEADQNRFIYKPLPRDMSVLQPGTVIMLRNRAWSSTLGAPVLILENEYPRFRFLRIKKMDENAHFNSAAKRKTENTYATCLEISRFPKEGHDRTPVMLLEADSPDMREPSYVEVRVRAKMALLDLCESWCWPPVKFRLQSMELLREHMRRSAMPME